MRHLLWVSAILMSATGCDHFEKAGPVECEALYNHVVEVSIAEQAGTEDRAAGGSAAENLARMAVQS